MLRFDPQSASPYAPVFRWAGAYFGKAPTTLKTAELQALARGARPVYLRATRDTLFVPDAWVQAEIDPEGPLACRALANLRGEGLHVAEGVEALYGPTVFGLVDAPAISIRFDVHWMRTDPLPSRLVRKYGNRDRAGEHWMTDLDVRSHYTTLAPSFCTVALLEGALLFEVPDMRILYPPALRTACIWAARDCLYQMVLRGVPDPQRHTQFLPPEDAAVAFKEGSAERTKADLWAPRDRSALLVETRTGDGRRELPIEGVVNRSVTARTHVRGKEHEGLRWMRVCPPQTKSDVEDFNQFLARFPHRLYSAEVRRLQSVFAVLERLETFDKSILQQKELYTVLTSDSDKEYFCVDGVPECLAGQPHVWSTR